MNRTDIKNILYKFYEKINTDKHKKTKKCTVHDQNKTEI